MVIERRESTIGAASLDPASEMAPRPAADVIHPRNPWLAALSGLLLPSIGFAYVGRPLGVIFLHAIVIATWVVFGWTGMAQTLSGIWIVYLVGFGATVFAALFCVYVARKTRSTYRRKWFNRWYYYIAFLLVSTLPVVYVNTHRATCLGFDTYRVPSGAMQPTIEIGEMIVVDTRPDTIHGLKRGDIAILVVDSTTEVRFVKRIVAEPGEHVQITSEGIVVDNVVQSREHTKGSDTLQQRWMVYTDVTLGDDQFYVLGDNRGNSIDSRTHGPVARENLRAKATAIFFSSDFRHLGPLQ